MQSNTEQSLLPPVDSNLHSSLCSNPNIQKYGNSPITSTVWYIPSTCVRDKV